MAFIDELLYPPSYGWKNDRGELIRPTSGKIWNEMWQRSNIFRSRKNWISFASVIMAICFLPFVFVFITQYMSWGYLLVFLLYSMIIMGTHGTIWYHRYGTHRSFKFSRSIWKILTQHLVIKTIPEEIYIVSHHVHHAKSDEPGDPYNARAGFLYCMLAEFNHQRIAPNLDEYAYRKAARFMQHTGVAINSYAQYRKWGSVTAPLQAIGVWMLNWAVWLTILYVMGGWGLVTCIFSAAFFWFILVRAFNYTGHGKGEAKHVHGIDFDHSNLSVNQWRPGLFAGEWHNNHHLFPGSARAGFLKYQLDLPWVYIYSLYKLGAVSSYHDSKKEFLSRYKERPRK